MPDETEHSPPAPGSADEPVATEQSAHIDPPPLTTHGETAIEFQALDPRVINLWRLQQTIGAFFLLSFALIVGTLFALANPGAKLWIFGAWLGLACLRLFLLIWYPGRAFLARGYRIDANVLETRRGIWFKVITLLPLSRLQHVDLNRGPLERLFGLASLVLYTAGTQHSMVIIPGLDEAEASRLRDHLVAVGGDDAV